MVSKPGDVVRHKPTGAVYMCVGFDDLNGQYLLGRWLTGIFLNTMAYLRADDADMFHVLASLPVRVD